MDSADSELVNKCENLMNIVVESRKRFGQMCVDYEKKSSLMEKKKLNLQIETFSNYKFNPKNPAPPCENEDIIYLEEFSLEMSKQMRFIDNLRRKIKCTQEVVAQLKRDSIGKRLREPLTAEVLLAKTKDKKVM